MKRSEALLKIATALKDQWYAENGPKLKGSTYIGYSIADGYKQAKTALAAMELEGMLPPPCDWAIHENIHEWDKENETF